MATHDEGEENLKVSRPGTGGVGASLQQPPRQAMRAKTPGSRVKPTAIQAPEAKPSTLPPVMIYLPGLPQTAANSSLRIAQLMAIKLDNGPGAFHAEEVRSPSKHLCNGQCIVEDKSGPVLDLYMLDYRPQLQLATVTGTGIGASLRRFALALWYFLRALELVLNAGRKAKKPVAKWQVLIGLGAVGLLLASVVFTALSVLVSVGLWKEPAVSGNAADAVALSATAFTTWLIFKACPAMQKAAAQIEQIIDYVQNERHAAGVTSGLDAALDDILEAEPGRKIHLFGYSLGALIAVDFLYPRKSLLQPLDPRHAKAISTLVTIGCPIDFVRLYISSYIEDRQPRVPNLRWTNVFIAADVLGSNLIDGDDYEEAPDPEEGSKSREATVTGVRPTFSRRYTSEQLSFWNIWGGKGFLSHGGYWDEPNNENCLHLVIEAVFAASFQEP